jgi:hypothetical protein
MIGWSALFLSAASNAEWMRQADKPEAMENAGAAVSLNAGSAPE